MGRYLGTIGIYREKLKLQKQGDTASLVIAHMNPGQSFEVEFLVGGYDHEKFEVDMAEPDVRLQAVRRGDESSKVGLLRSLGFGMLGVKFDPNAVQTARLAEEMARLNRTVELATRKGSYGHRGEDT